MINHEFQYHVASLLETLPSLQEGYEVVSINEYIDVINEVMSLALSSEMQLFSSHYAEWTFLLQKYPHLHRAGKLYHRFRALAYSEQAINRGNEIRLLCRAILGILAGREIDIIFPDIDDDHKEKPTTLFQGIIESWNMNDQEVIINCRSRMQEPLRCHLRHAHATLSTLRIGANLHITECSYDAAKQCHHSTEKSLCILEPDILFTATDIAECATNDDHLSIGSMFIKKFSKKQSGIPLLAGIITGNWLDKRISDTGEDINSVIQSTLKTMPLQAMNALQKDEDMEKLIEICTRLTIALEPIIETFDAPIISTESAFLAPHYGLTGRLDILLEYEDDPLKKTVIELKSGNAPDPGLPVHMQGHSLPMGAWKNHVIQVACYNLLLDSAFPGRTGESRLLYPKDPMNPIRNVINDHLAKREAMRIRNAILTLEHEIMERRFGALTALYSDEELKKMTPFAREEAMHFKAFMEQLDKSSLLYVYASISFILREQYSARVGTAQRPGLSAMWQYSVHEKQEKLLALGYLKLDTHSSDFSAFHLRFRFTELSQTMTSLRIGDIIVVYPHEAIATCGEIHGHVHKATIREITKDSIIISLRNKYAMRSYFSDENTFWCIESDAANESLSTGLIRSLGDVIRADAHRRHRVLGMKRPMKGEPFLGELPKFLHPTQEKLVRDILSSRDYYLLQGPPGTGKTSAIIRTVTDMLMKQEHECIILCAYTNRAVDELCATVQSLNLPFIRLGSKHATMFPENSLQELCEHSSLGELRAKLQSARIIISTVSTLHTHPEIHDWFTTTTMIVDEASQLLEPQLSGLLMHAGRFILIGDERQLPAVIMQDMQGTQLNNPLFENIALSDFRMSLFERLLKLCIMHGDEHAYGMLTVQARMHNDIAHIVSSMNYDECLQTMHSWQVEGLEIPLPEYPRLTWIETEPEKRYKIHEGEAKLAVNLACRALEQESNVTIGIITPFRSQIALIVSLIPECWKSSITVDTVERFQGSERDLIIISLTVHNEYHMRGIESLADIHGTIIDRKLNVALTRAKKQCIILGCPSALRPKSPYSQIWQRLKKNNL